MSVSDEALDGELLAASRVMSPTPPLSRDSVVSIKGCEGEGSGGLAWGEDDEKEEGRWRLRCKLRGLHSTLVGYGDEVGGCEAAPASGVGVRKVGVAATDDDENTKQQVSWLVGRERGKEAEVLRCRCLVFRLSEWREPSSLVWPWTPLPPGAAALGPSLLLSASLRDAMRQGATCWD